MPSVMNKYSRVITQDIRFGGPQAMLYATGLSEDDMQRPQVGIVANWYDGNPCNMHLNELAARVKEGVVAAGLVGMRFNTIGVSDGISQGTDGMSYSLPSRDIIADSIETVMSAQWYDGDHRHPRLRQEHARLHHGHGPLEPPRADDLRRHDPPRRVGGPAAGHRLGLQGYGEFLAGRIDDATRRAIVRHSCPGAGACGGMYTANTMSSVIEALGMSLPYSASTPAEDSGEARRVLSRRAGHAASAGTRHQAARHHHPQGLRERA